MNCRHVIGPVFLALIYLLIFSNTAFSRTEQDKKFYNHGPLSYQLSDEYKEKRKLYKQAWDNIRTRIVKKLEDLNFYPRKSRSPLTGIPGSLDGSFYYGSRQPRISVSIPRKKLTSPTRGERKLITEPPREAKFNANKLRVHFTPSAQIHNPRNWNKKTWEWARNPELVIGPRSYKDSIWVFKEGGYKSMSFESTSKRVAIRKTFGGFPGEMFLKVQKGQTYLIEGEYSRRGKYWWYGEGIDIDAPYDINAYFEYQDEEFPEDPSFQFGVRVTYRHTPTGWHPAVPRADESQIAQITQSVAGILKEELGALGQPNMAEEEPPPEPEVVEVEDSEDDGYWTWLVPYVFQQEEFHRRVDEVRMELGALANETDQLRSKWMKRLKLELEYEEGPGAEGPRMGVEVLRNNKIKRDELRQQIRAIKSQQQDLIDEILNLLHNLQESARRQSELNGDKRPGLKEEVNRLQDQEWFLKVELYDAAQWHNERELLALMKKFDFKRWDVPGVSLWYRAKARLADASNLDRRLWLQQTSPTPMPPDIPIIMAARTQRLEALSDLRRLLRKHPHHEQARLMIRQQEIYWLKQVAAKLDGEKKLALEAFRKYLTERGFNTDDKYGWWAGTTEFFATYFGLGPISLTAGVPGLDVPGGLADSVGEIQMGAVKNQIAINIMIRLVSNGIPLTEIPHITPEQLAETIVLNTKRGTPLPSHQARRMWREMKESFAALGILERLAADDPFYFAEDINNAFANSFYIPIDSEYHWYEYFGDIMSLRNIAAFFFPNTVLSKVNNRWFPVLISPEKVKALQEAGKWVTVRSKVTSILAPRLDQISRQLAEKRLMAFIQKKLASSPDLLLALEKMGEAGISSSSRIAQGLHYLGIKGLTGGIHTTKFAAIMMLWGGAHHLAYESGIPGATLLVDLIGEFDVAQQFWGALKHTGIELKLFEKRIKDLASHVELRKKEIQLINEAMDEIVDVGKKMRAAERAQTVQAQVGQRGDDLAQTVNRSVDPHGRTVSQGVDPHGATVGQSVNPGAETIGQSVNPRAQTVSEQADALAETVSASPGVTAHIPQNTDEAVEHAMGNSVNAMRSGDVAELERATTAAQSLNKTALERAETISEKVSKAEEIIVSASRISQTSDETIDALTKLRTIGEESDKALTPFFDPSHYSGPSGGLIRNADEALYLDNLDEALKLYQNAKRLELQLGVYGGPRAMYLEEKIALILNGKRSRQVLEAARALAPAEAAAKFPINGEEGKWVLDQFRQGNYKQISGGRNPLFEIKDPDSGQRLLVKKLESLDDLEAEVAVPVLANELGLHAPAARGIRESGIDITYEIVEEVEGQLIKKMKTSTLDFAVIVRPIDDFAELMSLHEHDLLGMRKQYAAQRTLKALVADSDGHARNVLMGPKGRIWIIDNDFANVTSTKLRQIGLPFVDHDDLIEAAITLSHGKLPGLPDENWAKIRDLFAKSPLYGRMKRFDQLIRFEDMAPTIEKMKALKAGTLQRKLQEAGFSEGRAKFIAKELKTRVEPLERTLKQERLFGGNNPIQLGSALYLIPPNHKLARLDHINLLSFSGFTGLSNYTCSGSVSNFQELRLSGSIDVWKKAA